MMAFDPQLRDKVRFRKLGNETIYEGEVLGINHIHLYIRYGAGPNDVYFLPIARADECGLELVKHALL